jgi:uncharacterized membrane protein YfcA
MSGAPDAVSDLLLFDAALAAAAVNGGLGWGFSSLTLPVALLFRASRVLNPAVVLTELAINGLSLLANRHALPAVLPRMRPMLAAALPGIVLGSAVLAWADPGWLKLLTFAVLLALVVLPAAGIGWRLGEQRGAWTAAGAGLGVLYGATTISGPPLALLLDEKHFSEAELRAAMSAFRVAASSVTALVYAAFGLYSRASLQIFSELLWAAAIGFPLGFFLLRGLSLQRLRRAGFSVDAVFVAFALVWTAVELRSGMTP